jgi:alkylation response protein AidB-like acyl-CoA dehydrogenase
MRLALSDDQRDLFEAFDQFFRRESPSAVVRATEPVGFDRALWRKLAAMEVWGRHVPLAQLCVIGETAGRSIAPVPFAEHAVVSRLLDRSELTSGAMIGGLAVRETDVNGVWRLVPAGAVADVVIGVDGASVVATSSAAPGAGPRNHADAPLADRSAVVGERTVLGPRGSFDRPLAEWKVLTAAMLVGIASRALEMAVAYVGERHQFGVPIGSFQAVQHGLADLPGSIDGARLLVHEAAAALDSDLPGGGCDVVHNDIDDPHALASMAVLFAADVAAHATDRSLHFHGGYGFAEEYDIQLYHRRARGWALVLGDPADEYQRLAAILWPEPAA